MAAMVLSKLSKACRGEIAQQPIPTAASKVREAYHYHGHLKAYISPYHCALFAYQ